MPRTPSPLLALAEDPSPGFIPAGFGAAQLRPKCFGCVRAPRAGPGRDYTMFWEPGRGPCGGPGSGFPCSCASCSTGMLHRGHTFRTSSHLMRHLRTPGTLLTSVGTRVTSVGTHLISVGTPLTSLGTPDIDGELQKSHPKIPPLYPTLELCCCSVFNSPFGCLYVLLGFLGVFLCVYIQGFCIGMFYI